MGYYKNIVIEAHELGISAEEYMDLMNSNKLEGAKNHEVLEQFLFLSEESDLLVEIGQQSKLEK